MSEKQEAMAYQSMLQEVEEIVRSVASPEMDLDQMVGRVERGYELIQKMQERLDTTKERVDELSKKFEK